MRASAPQARAPALRVRMLDGFAVELADGRKVGPWSRPSARRLVQVLLLSTGHRVGREELAETLFPRLSPERAANAVSKALTLARAALERGGPRVLEADRATIWLREDVGLALDLDDHLASLRAALAESDSARRDELLEAALAERGRLLDGELYADWALAAREQLDRLRARARLELARGRSAGQGARGFSRLIDAWAEVVAHEPTSEEACEALIRAYGRAGQRDLAVRAYHRFRAALQEVGLDPPESVEAAYREARQSPPHRPEAAPAPVAPAPLVFGRQRELQRLVDGLTEWGSFLVSGPAGIGKTHLLRAAAHRLDRSSWRVLHGTAVPADRRAPFASLRLALAPLLHGLPDDGSPLARLAGIGPAGLEQAQLAPTDDDQRARLSEQLARLLDEGAGPSPVLLVLDDVQWADLELQSLLARLLAHERPRGWAVALGARSDERNAPVPKLPASVERLELGPIADRDVRAIVRATLGRQRLPSSRLTPIVERSAGNPFFAVELARMLGSAEADRVPETIVILLGSRLERCSAAARRLIPLVALAGAEASYELLLTIGAERALAGSPERTTRAIDELLDSHLLTEAESGVRLAHPLLGDAALAGVNTLRRAALEARLAEGLEQLGADPEVVARHQLAAFEAGRLREYAAAAAQAGFAAGRRARDLLAYDAAFELLEGGLAAFEATPAEKRGPLRSGAVSARLVLGDILHRRGQEAEANEAYESALALATTDEELARAWRYRGEIPYKRGDMAGAIEAYRRGLQSLRGDSPVPRALLSRELGWALHRMGRLEKALVILEGAYGVLEVDGEPSDAALCADLLATTLAGLGRHTEALAISDSAFRMAEAAESPRVQSIVHLHRAMILRGLGRLDEAMQHALASASSFGSVDRYKRAIVHWVTAEIKDELGDLEAALAERDREVELLLEIENPLNLTRAQAHRAQLLGRLGRGAEAGLAAEAAREAAAQTGDPDWPALVEFWLVGGKISGRPVS